MLFHLRILSVLAILPTLLTSPALQAAHGPPAVFQVLSDEVSASSLEARPSAGREILLAVDQGLIQDDPEAIVVALPEGGTAVARRSYWRWESPEEYHWFGTLEDAADSMKRCLRSNSLGGHSSAWHADIIVFPCLFTS